MSNRVFKGAMTLAMPLAWACIATGVASAQATDDGKSEFALGIGYAHVKIGSEDSVLHSEDMLKFDGALSFAPFKAVQQFRLGMALGVGMVLDNSERTIISNGGLVIIGSSDVPLLLLEPEARFSWQQWLANDRFYIEPGVGVGGMFANLNIDSDNPAIHDSIDKWDSSPSARAFINIGMPLDGGVAGIQASYLWADNLDLARNVRGEVGEFYIGFFGAIRF